MRRPKSRRGFPTPRIEGLEDRLLMAVNFTQNGDVLVITGSAGSNVINVTDNGTGGGNITATGDGTNFSSATHFREIRFDLKGGNDRVNFTLGNLTTERKIVVDSSTGNDTITLSAGKIGAELIVSGDLGLGNDKFSMTTTGITGNLDLEVGCGTGEDTASFTNTGNVESPLGSSALLEVKFNGDIGNDVIGITTGKILGGALEIRANGGTGVDRINVAVGEVKSVDSEAVGRHIASADIRVDGGADKDTTTVNVGNQASANVSVDSKGGLADDTMTVNLGNAAALVGFAASIQSLDVDGDAGNDRVTTKSGVLGGGSRLQATVKGGVGRDTVSLTQAAAIDALSQAILSLDGGADNDTVSYSFSGQLTGRILLSVDGGLAEDNVTANLNLQAGSSGKIGDAGLGSVVSGGAGNDKVTYIVHTNPNPPVTLVTAQAVGGSGIDQIKRTVNVSGDLSNETDTIVS